MENYFAKFAGFDLKKIMGKLERILSKDIIQLL